MAWAMEAATTQCAICVTHAPLTSFSAFSAATLAAFCRLLNSLRR